MVTLPVATIAEPHLSVIDCLPKHCTSIACALRFAAVVAMVWEGKNAVATGRKMIGATNPANSEPGTIRGDLCIEVGRNIIHGSDSVEVRRSGHAAECAWSGVWAQQLVRGQLQCTGVL